MREVDSTGNGMCKEEGVTLDRTCYLGVCWVLGEGLRKQGFALE